MAFRVMAGLSAIWAGKTRELKDGVMTMPYTKYNVTDDVLVAATTWLAEKGMEYVVVTESGRRITLKVKIEEAKE